MFFLLDFFAKMQYHYVVLIYIVGGYENERRKQKICRNCLGNS